jgi:AraC-like DNA-binding protein
MLVLDSLLRGALIAQWCLLAGLFYRHKAHSLSALFGLLLMLGLCCQTLESMAALRLILPMPVQAVLAGIATANSVLAWQWILSLFNDQFRWRKIHALWWLAVFALAFCNFPLGGPWSFHPASFTHALQRLVPLLFAISSLWAVWANRDADLVAARRRLRWVLLGGSLCYVLVTASLRLTLGSGTLPPQWAILDSLLLLIVTSLSLYLVLREANLFTDWLPKVSVPRETAAIASSAWIETDRLKIPLIEAWVQQEKAYRRADFQLTDVATALGLPEYRARKLIHEGLGFRNFNAFVNHYRLQEVKAKLSDPHFQNESILNLALEAGFGSLAPFNKAFKLQEEMTPSEFRRRAQPNASRTDGFLK